MARITRVGNHWSRPSSGYRKKTALLSIQSDFWERKSSVERAAHCRRCLSALVASHFSPRLSTKWTKLAKPLPTTSATSTPSATSRPTPALLADIAPFASMPRERALVSSLFARNRVTTQERIVPKPTHNRLSLIHISEPTRLL